MITPYAPPISFQKTQRSSSLIVKLIWLYIILLIFEGALRKWVMPGLSDILLLIRDPLALLIYTIALAKNQFPMNGYIISIMGLAIFAFLGALCADEIHGMVLFYGMRANFLHMPLIFIMGNCITRNDLEKMSKFFLWMSIFMSALLILQFHAPITARINLMPGGQIGGIIGAKGRFRPAGTFSFITGVACFYPLVTAFLFQQFIGKKQFKWILTALFATAVACAIPFSISRQNALSCGLVILASIPAAIWSGRNLRYLYRMMVGGISLAIILSFLPFFSEGISTFLERWTMATGDDVGGVKTALVDRYLSYLTDPFVIDAPFFGYGIGMGSNAGAKLLTGEVGFLMAEGEWSRIILEMGPLIGWLFILFRIVLVFNLGLQALSATKAHKDPLPTLLFASALPLVFNGQLNPPTILGFAIITAGLCLSAVQHPPMPEPEEMHDPTPKNITHRQLYS